MFGQSGLNRPRRLSPLSLDKKFETMNNVSDYDVDASLHHDVIPAPGGLHLSVNYTNSLGLGNLFYYFRLYNKSIH